MKTVKRERKDQRGFETKWFDFTADYIRIYPDGRREPGKQQLFTEYKDATPQQLIQIALDGLRGVFEDTGCDYVVTSAHYTGKSYWRDDV